MEIYLIVILICAALGLIIGIIGIILRPRSEAIGSSVRDELERLGTTLQNDNSNHRQELSALLSGIKTELGQSLKDNRGELNDSLDKFRGTLESKMNEFSAALKGSSEEMQRKQDEIRNTSDAKLEAIRKTMQERLEQLQDANGKKLDEMRQTVDEKLQATLNTRINEAFKQVSEQLDKVHSGLGAMTSLANDVGGLKKVLTNVKTRGMIGEIQLEALLSSVLSPEQYDANVQIRKNSQERVEFAIRLPGRDDDDSVVLLPIDSKFPDEPYQKLLLAYDEADPARITIARRDLANAIKSSAKDIRDKYIDPPATTAWAILFLPFEGLYAEVLQNTALVHQLQNDYHITLTGPTTLGAFINSLQMGFRTLAIQKRSGEVWKLLGAVKTQFNAFGEVLDATQRKLRGASDDLDKLVGTRTRMIQSKLRQVELLPEGQATAMLDVSDIKALDSETENGE